MPRKKLDYKELMDIVPVSDKEKVDSIISTFCDNLHLDEVPDMDVWCDQNRFLAQGVASEYGRWVTDRFPFTRKIMKALSPSSIAKMIVWIKGAQVAATELAINAMFYYSKVVPTPFLYTQKTKDAAEDFSKQKLAPNIECNPIVTDTLGPKKPKYLSDEVLDKGFPGGFISMGGANSGAFLRSKSVGFGVTDEEDSYPASTDKEGKPYAVIRKRGANYPNFKLYRPSTPKIKETSTIEPAYEDGSQEKYYVPCPHCNPDALRSNTYWTIEWGNIAWAKDSKGEDIIDPITGLPADIYLICQTCGSKIYETSKTWMLDNGVWMSEKGSPGKPYEVGDVENPSFHLSSLYSPYGFFSWKDAVQEWFEYKKNGDRDILQVFVNQTLGETFSAAGADISHNYLYNRRETYTAEVPLGGLVLTGGFDVQEDRIEGEIVAWGLNEENWGIEYVVFMGRTDTLGDHNGLDENGNPTAWRLLDEFLYKTYKNEFGKELEIECTFIDVGYRSEVVHVFCRYREHRRIFPTKGHTGWGKGFIEHPKKRHERYHTYAFKSFVDELKDKTYALLLVDRVGPGYCHYPANDNYHEKYFKGLTAENKEVVVVGGHKKLKWVCPSGARNEPLDCRNYAYSALKAYPINLQYRAEQQGILVEEAGNFTVPTNITTPPIVKKKSKKRNGSKGL